MPELCDHKHVEPLTPWVAIVDEEGNVTHNGEYRQVRCADCAEPIHEMRESQSA